MIILKFQGEASAPPCPAGVHVFIQESRKIMNEKWLVLKINLGLYTYRDKISSQLLDQPLPNLLSHFCSYCGGIYWNSKKGSCNVFNCRFCERCVANKKEEQRKIENDKNFRCLFCQLSSKPCSNLTKT